MCCIIMRLLMSYLNIYLSRNREKWIRKELVRIATEKDRSISYLVEEALLEYLHAKGSVLPAEGLNRTRRLKI